MQPAYMPEDAVPPAEVRFEELRAEPLGDPQKVRIYIKVTPFQVQPSIRAAIHNAAGEAVVNASIIETMQHHMVLTLHLRLPDPSGAYKLAAELYYEDLGVIDKSETSFEVAPPES
jgi:hypothetical protein